jgi:hypothetical protein
LVLRKVPQTTKGGSLPGCVGKSRKLKLKCRSGFLLPAFPISVLFRSHLLKQMLLKEGVPGSAIHVTDDQVMNMYEEAVAVPTGPARIPIQESNTETLTC